MPGADHRAAVNNSIIAYLILLHFYVKRSPAIGLLGAAFVYPALMVCYQLLILPEVFPGQQGMQPGTHQSLWLWFARLAGFAMLIMLAMLCLPWQPKLPPSPRLSNGFLLGCLLLALSPIWLAHSDWHLICATWDGWSVTKVTTLRCVTVVS